MTRRFQIDRLEERIAPTAGNIPEFVAAWHGVGPDHQAGNDPGDTASERHGFANDTAGGSDQNPTDGSNG